MRVWMHKYIGNLFMEQKEVVDNLGYRQLRSVMSLGRTSFIVLLSLAMYLWYKGGDIQSGMLQLLLVLAAYNFGSKAVEAVKGWLAARVNALDEIRSPQNEKTSKIVAD